MRRNFIMSHTTISDFLCLFMFLSTATEKYDVATYFGNSQFGNRFPDMTNESVTFNIISKT